jgi:hypothetical protein
LRATIAELGPGRETDRTLSELGLFGANVVIEGGQPHKVVAELGMVLDDHNASPQAIILSGSSRTITNPAEVASAERLGVSAATEYEMVRKVVESTEGFKPLPLDTILRLSYDIDNQYAVGHDSAGQFIHIGTLLDADVILMRIDREHFIGSTPGTPPNSGDVMKIVHEITRANGDDTSPVALVTSATYQPSREVDAARVAVQTGRTIGVPTYGTSRLASVKGEPVPAPAPINQLPGELHKLALQTELLRQTLHDQ